MNKVKAGITSRALQQELKELEARTHELETQKDEIRQKLDKLRADSTSFAVFGSSVGISPTISFNPSIEVEKITAKEIWLNDHIYIDALGVHNLNEKEES